MSSITLGITSGTTPNAAYFASATSTRTAGGIAGYGSPSSGMMSITAVRSLPLTTSVDGRAAVGADLVVGHHAVDQHGRRAADA